jgi:UDP-glucose 6-dehydrogenase
MKFTVAGRSFTGCNNRICYAELWPQVNGTYIPEEKRNTLQNDQPLINSSIKELLQSYKPPNVITKDDQMTFLNKNLKNNGKAA